MPPRPSTKLTQNIDAAMKTAMKRQHRSEIPVAVLYALRDGKPSRVGVKISRALVKKPHIYSKMVMLYDAMIKLEFGRSKVPVEVLNKISKTVSFAVTSLILCGRAATAFDLIGAFGKIVCATDAAKGTVSAVLGFLCKCLYNAKLSQLVRIAVERATTDDDFEAVSLATRVHTDLSIAVIKQLKAAEAQGTVSDATSNGLRAILGIGEREFFPVPVPPPLSSLSPPPPLPAPAPVEEKGEEELFINAYDLIEVNRLLEEDEEEPPSPMLTAVHTRPGWRRPTGETLYTYFRVSGNKFQVLGKGVDASAPLPLQKATVEQLLCHEDPL